MELEDFSPPWTARERVVLDKMEKHLEKGESIEVSELEHFLLGPEETDVSITSFAENARDEGGCSTFVLLDTPRGRGAGRGVEVADAAGFAKAAREVTRGEAASATRKRATRRARRQRYFEHEILITHNCS